MDPGILEMAGAAYQRYRRWADKEGLSLAIRLTGTAFGTRMKAQFRNARKAAGTVYFGVGPRLDRSEPNRDV